LRLVGVGALDFEPVVVDLSFYQVATEGGDFPEFRELGGLLKGDFLICPVGLTDIEAGRLGWGGDSPQDEVGFFALE
jgi:hypothetical protein